MIRFLVFTKSHWVMLTLFILASITTLSLWPLDTLPDIPGTDKTHHLIAYAVLVFPAALAKPHKWIMFCVLFISWSGAIELIQPYVNRYGEWLDLAANAAGVVIGLILAALINYSFPMSTEN